jgi:hypothetical protein
MTMLLCIHHTLFTPLLVFSPTTYMILYPLAFMNERGCIRFPGTYSKVLLVKTPTTAKGFT